VWSASLGAFQVVSEEARAHGKPSSKTGRRRVGKRLAMQALATSVAFAAGSGTAFASALITVGGTPVGPGVPTSSGANWSWDGSNLTINQGGTVASGNSNAITNAGTIGTLSNSGTVSGSARGIYNIGTTDTLSNGGIVSGGNTGIDNAGTIGALSNSGTISGSQWGIYNESGSSIGTLTNSRAISSDSGVGIGNWGSITALTNSGAISGESGIFNNASIGTLSNSGTITGTGHISGVSTDGIGNVGTIGVLSNSGAVIGGTNGILNQGLIGTLSNSGTISGGVDGIYNSGTIGAVSNSGTISGSSYAIDNDVGGSTGPITNSGVIAGNILNATNTALTINGGTGTVFGTLTGYGGTVGTISSTASNLVFGSGNVMLNDSIDVGTNTVTNTGATLAVNAPMTITGNYSQGQAATLLIGVVSGASATGSLSDTGYGRLVVQGDATIAAGSSVTLQGTGGGYGFAAGQRFVVVDATGTGTYNAGALNYAIAGYTATMTGTTVSTSGHDDLVVTVDSATPDSTGAGTSTGTGGNSTGGSSPARSPSTEASLASAPNAAASLHGLLSYTGVAQPQLLNLYNATLAALGTGSGASSSASANRIGQQLAPSQTANAAVTPTFGMLGIVNAHVDSLHVADAQGATGVATGDSPSQWTAWGQGFGGHASQDERDDVDGYSANYGGLIVGADRAFGEHWRVGGVFSYSHTAIDDSDSTAGDSTGVNQYGLIGYASYAGSPWYVNVSGGVSLQHYDTTRLVSMPGFSGVAGGSFNGQQYVANAEAGYPLELGSVTVTPLANLMYSYLNQNSYTETGGNGAALSVGNSHVNSVRSALGAKLEKGFQTSYGVLVPELRVQWIHEYDHAKQTTGASFAGDPTGQTAFTTVGMTPISDFADLSLGVTLVRANNLSLTVRYELQVGSGFVSNTGILRLQQQF
jgi:outer membrane autotransporter protein